MKFHDKEDPRQRAPQCPGLKPVRTVHRNPWFAVRNRGGYYTVEYSARQVAVLPVVERLAVVLVRVKRPILNDVTLELPAGGSNANETAIQTAVREMREETGITVKAAQRYRPLPPLVISSARYPVMPTVFRVDLSAREYAARGRHDDEIAGVECLPFAEVKRLIASGTIYVSLVVAVLAGFLFRQDFKKTAR